MKSQTPKLNWQLPREEGKVLSVLAVLEARVAPEDLLNILVKGLAMIKRIGKRSLILGSEWSQVSSSPL